MIDFDDWRMTNHETLEDDFTRYMAVRTFVPSTYFPALYILRHFPTPVEGGDFIYANSEIIFDIDFMFFRALLVAKKCPLFMRIHFTTTLYNMPEEMAEYIDKVGHSVLIVGYNSDGFIVHDPWNKEQWGGTQGGAYTLLDYKTVHPLMAP